MINIISELGRKMDHPLQKGATLDAFFDFPRPVYAPLDFEDEEVTDYQLIAPFPTEPFSYDKGNEWAKNLAEVRIIWQVNVEKHVDAWGVLRIPFSRYQVLRQKVTEKLFPAIEVKDMNGDWLPARDMGIEAPNLPAIINEYYVFWSNELNHAPAIVYVRPGTMEIKKILYKAFEFGSRIIQESPKGTDVIAYPNPAFNDVRFDFINLPEGTYNLDVYNILGVRLQSFEVTVDGYTTAQFDLSDLKKGTYIYRVTNEGNRTITSKRLIIIQP